MTKSQMLESMLRKQISLNQQVSGLNWDSQELNWHTSLWVECAEVMETIDWKWWKTTGFKRDEFIAEMVDVWHFGMTMMLIPEPYTTDELAHLSQSLGADWEFIEFAEHDYSTGDQKQLSNLLHVYIERMVMSAMAHRFDRITFFRMLRMVGLSIEDLYRHYTAKFALNVFRASRGYNAGSYLWTSKEDNQRLQNWIAVCQNSPAEHIEYQVTEYLKDAYFEEFGQ